jgi:hypothetical protein
MNILNFHKTERSLLRAAVLLVLLVCGFLVLVDQLSIYWGLGIWQRVADDFTGGIIAASIFYLYERRARRQFHEQLHLVDLMNHHIRNALQPLMFVPFQPEAAVQKQLVEECVDHIDWALREILPGKSHERFVAQAADFTGGLPKIESNPRGSTNSKHSRREPENCNPQTFFVQWFETWKNRNRTVPDEHVAGGFSDRVNSSPWKNYRAAFSQRKQGGHNA